MEIAFEHGVNLIVCIYKVSHEKACKMLEIAMRDADVGYDDIEGIGELLEYEFAVLRREAVEGDEDYNYPSGPDDDGV